MLPWAREKEEEKYNKYSKHLRFPSLRLGKIYVQILSSLVRICVFNFRRIWIQLNSILSFPPAHTLRLLVSCVWQQHGRKSVWDTKQIKIRCEEITFDKMLLSMMLNFFSNIWSFDRLTYKSQKRKEKLNCRDFDSDCSVVHAFSHSYMSMRMSITCKVGRYWRCYFRELHSATRNS